MPSLQDCTPDASPPVTPPNIFPAPWQTGHAFSECFLLYVQEEALRNLLRTIGCALFDAFLNASLPEFPEGVTVAELRAAVADLRHLQGYLAGVGQEHEEAPEEAPLTEPEMVLSQFAARQAVELARVADEIEAALDKAGA
jgi:hypothetical protein